jgi:hypothetical protein
MSSSNFPANCLLIGFLGEGLFLPFPPRAADFGFHPEWKAKYALRAHNLYRKYLDLLLCDARGERLRFKYSSLTTWAMTATFAAFHKKSRVTPFFSAPLQIFLPAVILDGFFHGFVKGGGDLSSML